MTVASGGPEEKDDLLPIARRKVFDRDLPEAVLQCERAQQPCSLLMIDIDHFKNFNDRHGHRVGDEVLIAVAQVLEQSVTLKGAAYRYGGEELSVLLRNFSTEEAAAVGERIRLAVSTQRLTAASLSVTVSIGVATCPVHANDAITLIQRADNAMYEAKRLGRNLVRVAGEPQPTSEKRAPARKAPSTGVLDGDVIRALYFSGRRAACAQDGAMLRILESQPIGRRTPDLLVSCPMCGMSERLVGPD